MEKLIPSFQSFFRGQLLIMLFCLPLVVSAQKSSELGFMAGLAAYSGDLAPSPFAANRGGFALGVSYRNMFNPKIGVRAGVNYARFNANRLDVPQFNEPTQNVKMEMGLVEITANFEWHPLGGPRFNNVDILEKNWTPFFATGLGLSFGEAQITTESEFRGRFPENDDKNTFLTVPFIGGVRFDISQFSTISLEVGARAVFSDYFDGVSVNGNPDNSDWYWLGGISYVYFLSGEKGISTSTGGGKSTRNNNRRRR